MRRQVGDGGKVDVERMKRSRLEQTKGLEMEKNKGIWIFE